MRIFPAILLLALAPLATPAADAPSSISGAWTLDTASSDSPEALLDKALATYREPKARSPRRADPEDTIGGVVQEMEQSIGPILKRPRGETLRAELLPLVTPPASLTVETRGDEVLIRTAGRGDKRLSIGRPHARVDAQGTAKIRASWKSGSLIVTESYDGKRSYTETYTPQRDGSLLVLRDVKRPGLAPLHTRTLYRRG